MTPNFQNEIFFFKSVKYNTNNVLQKLPYTHLVTTFPLQHV